MYSSRTKVVFWYEDDYGIKWEHITTLDNFKSTAIDLLEECIDNDCKLFYTINNTTRELDYYNTEL